MVTFVCQYCDVTLKKKQVQGHIRGRCSPGAMICIDCSQTFYGNDHKAHISCISQQEKHWGQFAKTKKTKPIQKQPKQVKQDLKPNNKKQQPIQAPTKKQQEQVESKANMENGQQKKEQNLWKGWKNEIKHLIRNSDNKIEKEQLKKKLRKLYKKKVQQTTQSQFQQIFNEKISKIKDLKQVVYYTIQEQYEQ